LQASFRSLGVWGKCFGAASSSSLAPLFDLRARSPLGAAFPNFDLSPRLDEVLFGRHFRTAPCLEVNLPRLTGSGKRRASKNITIALVGTPHSTSAVWTAASRA